MFDYLLVNNLDYQYLAFPITKDLDVYRDDFDSDAEPEERGEPNLHGFELAKFAFQHSHADLFQMAESHDFIRKIYDQQFKKAIQF